MRPLLLLLPVLLAGCGQSDSDPDPSGVTVGEARALNQAAADTDINAAEPANAQDAK
ncbi:MAG: hypothetical protein V4574_00190 [Pseudomonadota bacterium]